MAERSNGFEDRRPESLSGKYEGSFAYLTIRDRLPNILTKVLDVFCRLASSYHDQKSEDKAADAKEIVAKLSKLKNEMQTDKEILPIVDNYSDTLLWNDFIKHLQILIGGKTVPSWYTVAWLSCECYLYRRIFEALQMSQYHHCFDPFFEQKSKSFFSSETPIQTLASYVIQFTGNGNEEKSAQQLRLDFEMLLEYCLWGNKCDLSISAGTQVSNQLKESSQLKDLLEHIISNHTEKVWHHVLRIRNTPGVQNARIDFVLDNAGFELYTDLCFAEFLLDQKFCDVVYFHVKNVPWFVSDTTKKDFKWTIEQCANSSNKHVKELGIRWQNRLKSCSFKIIESPYWTLPNDYADMQAKHPDTYDMLAKSHLIFFKGDLNYRKLIGDRNWPHTTSFEDALHGFLPAPLCSLRTLKADLVVGLLENQAQVLNSKDKDWMTSGQYAVIQFAGETT